MEEINKKIGKLKNRYLDRLVLDSILFHIVVLDEDGIIQYANRRWKEFAQEEGLTVSQVDCGTNYLKVCDRIKKQSPDAKKAVKGIRDVISGRQDEFIMEYPCHSPTKKRWFKMWVTPLVGDEVNGAVIIHEDITKQRQFERRLEYNKNKIESLHKVATKMVTYHQREKVYNLTVEAAERILNFNICILSIKEDDQLSAKNTSSNVRVSDCSDIPCTSGFPGKSFQNNQSYLIEDIDESSAIDHIEKMNEYKSTLCVPINGFGVFQVVSKEVAAFDQNDLKLTELLISHTIAALERINSEEKIKYMNFHDNLTGLYDRGYFDKEIGRLDKQKKFPLSILIGDLNGLKLINDIFGHKAGDELLKKTANLINNSVRDKDIVARWGGDEFGIILPQTTEKDARRVLKRIKNNCEESDYRPIPPNIALGVATKTEINKTLKELFAEAENRMYANKKKNKRDADNKMLQALENKLLIDTNETLEHIERIKKLALRLGEAASLSTEQLDNLELAAQLHDIGKLAISKDVFNKYNLTEEDWKRIEKHSAIGYEIAKNFQRLTPISNSILYHHEWWNGQGYPEGLKEKEIPLLSRIIAIVDAYDVMINKSIYKEVVNKVQALEELKSKAGTQFDPELVKIFSKEINR